MSSKTTNLNYTFSRAIDDGGYFRSGYPIPAGTISNAPSASYKADQIERGVSTSNQPQHFVATTVWDWPLDRTFLADNHAERAVLGCFSFSGVYQLYSGSPLSITASSCQNNPAQSSKFCPASLSPSFSGPAQINGKWGDGAVTGTKHIDASAFQVAPDYTFGNAPRTAAYNLYGPGNYQLDLAAVRSFPLHITENARLDFRAEWYNVTNHTQFAVANTAVGNSSFGTVTQSGALNRKAAQFSARIEFQATTAVPDSGGCRLQRQPLSCPRNPRRKKKSMVRIGWFALASPILLATTLFAQDTRTVTEPSIPQACVTLQAQLAAPHGVLSDVDERKLDTDRFSVPSMVAMQAAPSS